MKHLEELLQKISQGDVAALEVFYTETKGALYSYALSILKNGHDAEDVLQDCYVQVYTKAGTYQAQGKPMAWLMTIVKNLCLIKLGEQKRLQSLPEDYGDTYWDDDRSSDIGNRIILQTILRELPEEDREIILLHVLFGYKHREIASSMKLPLSTVLSKYNRTLKKIRKMIHAASTQGGEPA